MKRGGLMDSKNSFDVGMTISSIPNIKNGSKITIGKTRSINVFVDQHFNWFQKRILGWCLGFKVKDYSEE